MMKQFYLSILMLLAGCLPLLASDNSCPPLAKTSVSVQTEQLTTSDKSGGMNSVHGLNKDEAKTLEQSVGLSSVIADEGAANPALDNHVLPADLSQHALAHNDNDFTYYIDKPNNFSNDVVFLLHGSGGNEKSLIPFARSIWPRATLVGIRGRVVQKGQIRWYKKITATRFDQQDVSQEANAFVKFLLKLTSENNLNTSHSIFIGYSNGANLLAVVLLQQPDLVRNAILMRSMPVLDEMPHSNLDKTNILTLSGQKDQLYSPFAPILSSLFKNNGAKVESYMVAADHMIGDVDKKVITGWLDHGLGQNHNMSAMSTIVDSKGSEQPKP